MKTRIVVITVLLLILCLPTQAQAPATHPRADCLEPMFVYFLEAEETTHAGDKTFQIWQQKICTDDLYLVPIESGLPLTEARLLLFEYLWNEDEGTCTGDKP